MSKRRSDDGAFCEMFLPAKRLAIDSAVTACPSGTRAFVPGSQACQAEISLGQASTSALTRDGTLEVWLAVAAQVHDALAALPGWIQVAQAVQYDQPEHLSSMSSASTPLPVQQHGSGNICGAWPGQPYAGRLAISDLIGSCNPSESPAAPVAASTPATAITASAAAADLPAQPAPAGATLDSCASESDTAAACGWFSKCRGCCQLTAGEVELQGQVVPLCRGCACTLHRRGPAEQGHMVDRIMAAHSALCQREAGGSG